MVSYKKRVLVEFVKYEIYMQRNLQIYLFMKHFQKIEKAQPLYPLIFLDILLLNTVRKEKRKSGKNLSRPKIR